VKNVCHRCEKECPSKRVRHLDYFYCDACKVAWSKHRPLDQPNETEEESQANEAFLREFTMDIPDRWCWEHKQESKCAKRELLELASQLKEVTTISVTYDGSGDSGEIDAVTFVSANGEEVRVEDEQLLHNIDNRAYELLPMGWEIDEGSYGELTIDVVNGSIHRVHNERILVVRTTEDDL
jgi:hypothetical protein